MDKKQNTQAKKSKKALVIGLSSFGVVSLAAAGTFCGLWLTKKSNEGSIVSDTHTVELKIGEGVIEGIPEDNKIQVADKSTIGQLPTPKRVGYSFDYWSDSANAKLDPDKEITTDMVVTAVYAVDPDVTVWTVTFDPKGGTFPTPIPSGKMTVADGTLIGTLPRPIAPTQTQTFIGWSTDGVQVLDNNTPITSNISLQALYDTPAGKVIINFDAPEGVILKGPTSSEFPEGDDKTFADVARPTAMKSKQTFKYWIHEDTGLEVKENDKIDDFENGETLTPVFDGEVTKVEIYEDIGAGSPALIQHADYSPTYHHYKMGTQTGAWLHANVIGQPGCETGVEWTIEDAGSYTQNRDFLFNVPGFPNGLIMALKESSAVGEIRPIKLRATSIADPSVYDEVYIHINNPLDVYADNMSADQFIIEVPKPDGWTFYQLDHYYYVTSAEDLCGSGAGGEIKGDFLINNGEFIDDLERAGLVPKVTLNMKTFNCPIAMGANVRVIPKDFLKKAESFNSPITFTSDLQVIGNDFMFGCTGLSGEFSLNGFAPSIIGDNFMMNTGFDDPVDPLTFNNVDLGDELMSIGNNFMNHSTYIGEIHLGPSLTHVGKKFMSNCPHFYNLFVDAPIGKEPIDWDDLTATGQDAPLYCEGDAGDNRVINVYGDYAIAFRQHCQDDEGTGRHYYTNVILNSLPIGDQKTVSISFDDEGDKTASFEGFGLNQPWDTVKESLSAHIEYVEFFPQNYDGRIDGSELRENTEITNGFYVDIPVYYGGHNTPGVYHISMCIVIKYLDNGIEHIIGKFNPLNISVSISGH